MSEKNEKEFGKARLLTAVQLARELGCDRKRIYYLKKIGKLGYESMKRKDGQFIFLYDKPYRAVESRQKYTTFSDMEKEVSYLILCAQSLRQKIVEASKRFAQEEKRLFESRLKV